MCAFKRELVTSSLPTSSPTLTTLRANPLISCLPFSTMLALVLPLLDIYLLIIKSHSGLPKPLARLPCPLNCVYWYRLSRASPAAGPSPGADSASSASYAGMKFSTAVDRDFSAEKIPRLQIWCKVQKGNATLVEYI